MGKPSSPKACPFFYASPSPPIPIGGFYKLALTDFRIYFEGKMLADKGA